MRRDEIINEYFEWMFRQACEGETDISYRRLFEHLHNTEFRWTIPMDGNRAQNGVELRWRFIYEYNYRAYREEIEGYLDGPCSVLEMLMALAFKCEDDYMDDPDAGNRTGQWIWIMLANLGLDSMYDERYNKEYVTASLDVFMDRQYKPDGEGGLFVIKNCPYDLRDVEIWYQLCWYLNSIL